MPQQPITVVFRDHRARVLMKNGNQGCAQAKPGDPWRPTFALMQLEKLIVFSCKSYAGYPGFYRFRAHGLLQFFLEHSLGQIVPL